MRGAAGARKTATRDTINNSNHHNAHHQTQQHIAPPRHTHSLLSHSSLSLTPICHTFSSLLSHSSLSLSPRYVGLVRPPAAPEPPAREPPTDAACPHLQVVHATKLSAAGESPLVEGGDELRNEGGEEGRKEGRKEGKKERRKEGRKEGRKEKDVYVYHWYIYILV